MGKKDVYTHDFWNSHPDCFAELFNMFVFKRHFVEEKNLNPVDTTEIFPDSVYSSEYFRDILRMLTLMEDGKVMYVLLGIEDSAYIDYAGPVKNCVYDALRLKRQVDDLGSKLNLTGDEKMSRFPKGGKIAPAVTLTVYWGSKPYDGPRRLFDMYEEEIVSEIGDVLNDYEMKLIVPAELRLEELQKLDTQMREVLGYIKVTNSKEQLNELMHSDKFRFRSVEEEIVEFLNVMTNSRFDCSTMQKQEGGLNMCKAIDDLYEDIRLARDEAEQAHNAVNDLHEELQQARDEAMQANDEAQKIQNELNCMRANLRRLGMSEEQIHELSRSSNA